MGARRITSIEGLRAFAILSILLYHFLPHQLPGGFLGVDVFLMLSGFLLTRRLVSEKDGLRPALYLKYVGKRMRRLYPPLMLMLVPVTVLLFLFRQALLLNLRGWVISAFLMVNNWWQIERQVSYFDQFFAPSVFTHLWYLSLNFQLSLLWPLVLSNRLVRSWNAKKQMLLLTAGILLSQLVQALLYSPGADPTRTYYGTDSRFLAFGAGALLVYLLPFIQERAALWRKRKAILNVLAAAALALILLLQKVLQDTSPLTYQGGMLLHTVAVAIFLWAALDRETLFHLLLRFKPIQWLGRRSYYIYLWYYPVFIVTQRFPVSFIGSRILLPFALIFLLAEGSHRLLLKLGESPWVCLRRRVTRWRGAWRNREEKRRVAWPLRGESLLVLAATGLFLTAFLTAPEGNPPAMEALKEQIAENMRQQEEQGQEEELTVVNPIEGLTPEVSTFAGNLDATFIGDSILLSALAEVQRVFPKSVVDGEVGRQLYHTTATVEQMRRDNMLRDTVVLLLGANGTYTEEQMDALLIAVGSERQVYLVTTNVPRSWRDSANGRMWQAKAEHANVQVLDWFAVSQDHPDWLREDGVHPNEEGSRQLALFLAQSIFELQK